MESGARAQTTVDFAIAMGIFLVALTAVVAFMPTMTQPFTGGQENPLLADRLASQLTDGQLADPSTPSKLNTTCTMYFFNGTSGDPCQTFDAQEDVQTKLAVDQSIQVNVSIQQNVTGGPSPDLVCATPGAESFSHVSSCSGQLMADGPAPPTVSGSITIARRYATLNETPVFVVVRVWT